MTNLIKHIYVLVFVFYGILIHAQKLSFINYTTKDGLLSDEVYNLHQDKKGYIWLFTNYGPMTYNGKKFSPALKNLPFEESVIYCFYENESGEKWLANSNKKIYKVINDNAFQVQGTREKSQQLKKNIHDIYQLFIDDSLNIYTKTFYKTTLFYKNKNYTPVDLEQKVKDDSCLYQVIIKGNGLISILNKKLFSNTSNPANFNVKFIDQADAKNNFVITVEGNTRLKYVKKFGNAIYFNTLNKIVKINPDHSTKNIIIDEQIHNFTKDKNNHLWIGCYGNGLYEFNENDSLINHYFKGKTVHDVLIDSENGLWISTDGSGIYYCRNLNEFYYDDPHPFGQPITFIKKIDDKLFVGSTDHHVFLVENGKVTRIAKKNEQLKDDPFDVIKFNNSFVVYYKLHAEELKGKSLLPQKLPGFNPAFLPYRVFTGGQDTLVFLSRNFIGILKNSSSGLYTGVGLKQILTNNKLFYYKKRNQDLLIATDDGVFCLRQDSLIRPAYLKNTQNCKVTKILTDAYGNFWFCSKGHGLFKLTIKNELINYALANGLPSNIVNDIYFKEDRSILLATNVGLFYYPNPGLSNKAIKIFNAEVQKCIPVKDLIYVSTKKGLIILNFSSSIKGTTVYFNLKEIYVNSKRVNNEELNTISYQNNNLDFRFDLISFTENHYPLKYKLSGRSDDDTGMVFADKVSFKNLAPGSYTLTVFPVIKNFPFQGVITTHFNIIPAFWQTLWFIVLCFSITIVVLSYIIWLLLSYRNNKKLKKAEANRIMAEYSLIALKSQINPHFMSNCLSAIQYLIVTNKIDEANQYLAKFSFLVRQVLNYSTSFFISLYQEIEIINLYVELEQFRFEKKFKFNLTLDPAIPTDEFQIPSLLLQPIIENAIWQGLQSLNPEHTAIFSLDISREGDYVKIKIEDNGIARQMDDNYVDELLNASEGINITRKRLENLKELYHYHMAEIVSETVTGDLDQAIGMRIIITLPFNLSRKV